MIPINNDINNVVEFAKSAFAGSGSAFQGDKISIGTHYRTRRVSQAVTVPATFSFAMFSGETPVMPSGYTFIPQLFYGYLSASVLITAAAGGATSNFDLYIQNYSLDGVINRIYLPFGSALRNPDPGTEIAIAPNSHFTFQTQVPILMQDVVLEISTANLISYTAAVAMTFNGIRLMPS